MTTIAYDLPVKDFIAGLDRTGHVSHTQHRKTHVTIHHNGGRLSHEGVLSVWQVRPASAHFNIDGPGTAAQFVRVNEYAWATGSTEGNQRSISIEMCNLTLAPDWLVGENTWRGAARLAGWLFARVIGYRPTSEFLVPHHRWNPTVCAGPYIDKIMGQIVSLAQHYYDMFTGGDDMPEEITLYGGKKITYNAWAAQVYGAITDTHDMFKFPIIPSGSGDYKLSGTDLLRYIDLNGIKLDQLLTIVGTIAKDENVTGDTLKELVEAAAVKTGKEMGQVVADRLSAQINTLVEEALEKIQAEDNAAEVEMLLRRIGSLASASQ